MDLSRYEHIAQSGVWAIDELSMALAPGAEVRLSYQRAAELCRKSGMTVQDIVTLSPKFWQYHNDYIATRDTASHTILTIHWNLCIGTIGTYARNRKDLHPLLMQLEAFDVCGEFMLTEIGHGLDARNIETLATLQPDGFFDLHTPTSSAAKIMPPTTLMAGFARVAVVFAQLVVDGERRGVRPFVVRINEVDAMCDGITSKALPTRGGAKCVDHAVTSFNHVRLEGNSLLGSLEKPEDIRTHFLKQIWRVSVGTLALSMHNPASLNMCAWVAARYSQRRHVTGPGPDGTVPIISFRTQQLPILRALAHAPVFNQFSVFAIDKFMQPGDPRVAHGMACTYKALVVGASQNMMNELVNRLGWQGLFPHSKIMEQMLAGRGNAIAEGDSLVLCIRLASELLINRYQLPEARDPNSLLARHEAGIMEAGRRKLQEFTRGHRSEAFNAHILPRCLPIVEAIGQRMAYEAALSSGAVRPALLELFEVSCLLKDAAWYIEHAGLRMEELLEREAAIVDELMPQLDVILAETAAESYGASPLLSEKSFSDFVRGLPSSNGSEFQQRTGDLELVHARL